MAAAATLNPELSIPRGRKQQHLPPKSYIAATNENHDPQSLQSQSSPEVCAGQGEDVTQRSPSKNMHKKSGSTRVNGYSKDTRGPTVVVERYEDKDGGRLVSVEQAWDGQKSMTRRNSVLVSGRRAGAGWEQSQ